MKSKSCHRAECKFYHLLGTKKIEPKNITQIKTSIQPSTSNIGGSSQNSTNFNQMQSGNNQNNLVFLKEPELWAIAIEKLTAQMDWMMQWQENAQLMAPTQTLNKYDTNVRKGYKTCSSTVAFFSEKTQKNQLNLQFYSGFCRGMLFKISIKISIKIKTLKLVSIEVEVCFLSRAEAPSKKLNKLDKYLNICLVNRQF